MQSLAAKMRPQKLEDVLGQEALLGVEGPLSLALRTNQLSSFILWGPPGVGKTSIAYTIAASQHYYFMSYSAVYCGLKEVKQAIDIAKQKKATGQSSVLFIDEIHRFNKAQQDIFLPYIEDDTIILIGATTENPSFEINKALLSRMTVYQLQKLATPDLQKLLLRAQKYYPKINISQQVSNLIVSLADGDGRRLLKLAQEVFNTASTKNITEPDINLVNKLMASSRLRFDKFGDDFYNTISVLHKAIRGSDVNASIYWMLRMLEAGADPLYIGRRLLRAAWEDIGLADPRAIRICLDALATYERLGSPEGEIALVGAVSFLALAAKSNAIYKAANKGRKFVNNNPSYEVPLRFRNAPTKLMKDFGYGKDYRYPHDNPGHFIDDEHYLPDEIDELDLYQPSNNGLESKIAAKLEHIINLRKSFKKNQH